MLFAELTESQLEPEYKQIIDDLLKLKMSAPEVKEIPRITALNDFIYYNLASLRKSIETIPETPVKLWEPLNKLFLSILG